VAQNEVFVDTTCLIALLRKRDALHAIAIRVMDEMAREGVTLVTSDWVLAEFLGGASDPALRGAAAKMVHRLNAESASIVIEASRSTFRFALSLYESRPDKEWSLVDCASMLLCKERDIQRMLTHDHHFAQAGFVALLR
jgi:predicted nucleic acid-binding protein